MMISNYGYATKNVIGEKNEAGFEGPSLFIHVLQEFWEFMPTF